MPAAAAVRTGAAQPMLAPAQGGIQAAAQAETLGFATGGAQDVSNFRENVKAGYLPLPTDVTFEGIAEDYYFNTSRSVTAATRWAADQKCNTWQLPAPPRMQSHQPALRPALLPALLPGGQRRPAAECRVGKRHPSPHGGGA
jgi:hypothetical protein